MKTNWLKDRTNETVSLILLLLSLNLFWFSVARVDPAQTNGYNLWPWPDGQEYLAAAVAISESGKYQIHVGGEMLPPRYPFGMSLIYLPLIEAGLNPVSVPFVVNKIAGACLILVMFLGMWSLGYTVAAGISAICLASLPGFVALSRAPLSEIPGVLLVVTGFFLLARWMKSGGASGLAGSFVLGVSVWLRLNNCLFFIAPILFSLLNGNHSRRSRVVSAVLFSTIFISAVSPILIYNFVSFGSPATTGYSVWIPMTENSWEIFNFEHIPRNFREFWRDVLQRERGYSTGDIYGTGSYLGPSFFVLAVMAAVLGLRSRILQPFIVSSLLFLIVMLSYFYRDVRLLFPALILLIPVIAALFEAETKNSWRFSRSATVTAILSVLIVAQILGIPGKDKTLELAENLDTSTLKESPIAYESIRIAKRNFEPGAKLILTNWDPPYVYALTSGERNVAPLTWNHNYRFNQEFFRFGRDEIQENLERALAEQIKVYALVGPEVFNRVNGVRPPPPGFRWKLLEGNRLHGGLYLLEPLPQTPVKPSGELVSKLSNDLLSADPNPIRLCRETHGITRLTWKVPAASRPPKANGIEIRLNSPQGKLFIQSRRPGERSTGAWVYDGMTFYLLDTETREPLSAVEVKISREGCP